ncbi:NAD-dependent epimerase/dehydratase family protein [Hankyongella ginsenosidimutans]|uniref:NAD-dependent epimerase/dehydratase family protein n=1 Tax=Hankyongella ginsenosidimutans TaxID=1763828 RepID=UPI001FE8D832|nr:NAD(P)H-binding protein [Hankyongella ginsenosidimutans]
MGRHVVEQLVAAGYSVGVAARNIRGLPEIFSHERVTLVRADVTRGDDIARAIGSAKYVVNLAHGGASGSREAIVAAMVGSAEDVAEACLAKGVKRLVHVSSIAALWLGDPTETITPATQPDPNGAERGDYAFAKAEAERRLLKLYREKACR